MHVRAYQRRNHKAREREQKSEGVRDDDEKTSSQMNCLNNCERFLFALDNKIKYTPDQMEKPLVFSLDVAQSFFFLFFLLVIIHTKKRRLSNRNDKSKIKKKFKREIKRKNSSSTSDGITSYATLKSSLLKFMDGWMNRRKKKHK